MDDLCFNVTGGNLQVSHRLASLANRVCALGWFLTS
ncbi:uncharacterized protein METZ01_LOCUS278219, partial [marine metagenome]